MVGQTSNPKSDSNMKTLKEAIIDFCKLQECHKQKVGVSGPLPTDDYFLEMAYSELKEEIIRIEIKEAEKRIRDKYKDEEEYDDDEYNY